MQVSARLVRAGYRFGMRRRPEQYRPTAQLQSIARSWNWHADLEKLKTGQIAHLLDHEHPNFTVQTNVFVST